MDEPSDRPSPRRQQQQMQGPRPPRLHLLGKDSHKIKKPAPPRAPVIIYDASPKVIHTRPSEFMALVQRLTGPGPPTAAARLEEPLPAPFLPQELLLSPTAAHSPAARLAAIESSVRPMQLAPAQYIDITEEGDDAFAGALWPARPGILTPVPSALPPPVVSGLFSPLPFDPSCLSWLNELSPILTSSAAGNSNGSRLWFDPFSQSPSNLLATPAVPSPATIMEFFGNFPDL